MSSTVSEGEAHGCLYKDSTNAQILQCSTCLSRKGCYDKFVGVPYL